MVGEITNLNDCGDTEYFPQKPYRLPGPNINMASLRNYDNMGLGITFEKINLEGMK